jgi:hypothetical protein
MIEQAMARREHSLVQIVEIYHEALRIEFGRGQCHFELPSMPVDGDTRACVPTDVVSEVDVNASSDFVHRASEGECVSARRASEHAVSCIEPARPEARDPGHRARLGV